MQAPKLMFRRVIITKAMMVLAVLERDRGHLDASKGRLADARSHTRTGLEINPLDPELNRLKAEIESLAKGKGPPRDRRRATLSSTWSFEVSRRVGGVPI